MGRFVHLTLPNSGWDADLAYFVCTVHRAMQFAEGRSDCDPYLAVCDSYISSRVGDIDPLVPTIKIATYNRGTSPNDRWTICSVRGTESWQSWVGNLTGFAQRTDTRIRGHVHGYFLEAAQRLWLQIGPAFRDQVGNGRCIFTGHSLGGAVALAMAWFLKYTTPFAPAACITLGAPRLGDPVFANPAELQPCPVVRLENTWDPVAAVPPPIFAEPADSGWGPLYPVFQQWRHAGEGYVISTTQGIRRESDWNNATLASTLQNSGTPTIVDRLISHSNTEYAKRIANTLVMQPSSESTINVTHLHTINARISQITGEDWDPFA